MQFEWLASATQEQRRHLTHFCGPAEGHLQGVLHWQYFIFSSFYVLLRTLRLLFWIERKVENSLIKCLRIFSSWIGSQLN